MHTNTSLTFQSHYGAIATTPDMHKNVTTKTFQSHYGAIATILCWVGEEGWEALSIPLWCDCNSCLIALSTCSKYLSIPLWCDCNVDTVKLSSVVQRLSIPLWCDCNLYDEFPAELVFLLSIPLWCDCNSATVTRTDNKMSFQSHYGAIATDRNGRG